MRRIRLAGIFLAMAHAGCGGGSGGSAEDFNSCGPYPPQSTSPYVLPFQVGQSYLVKRGNCSGVGTHSSGMRLQYAYDFKMPIGTPLVASRDGTVFFVEERYPDFNHVSGEVNFILIQHEDGTLTNYAHLTQDGAYVNVGDAVLRGDIIGSSGASGDVADPHLHFHVEACPGCATVAVTFLNTVPQPHGLIEGMTYTAESY